MNNECRAKTFGPLLGIALVDAINLALFRHTHSRIGQDELANALEEGNQGIQLIWKVLLDQE